MSDEDSSSYADTGNGVADVPLPTDAAGWRDLFAAVPPRDLLRLIQKEKPRTARLFSGFRPSPEMLRHPVVQTRLLEEATKQPKFAQEVAKLLPTDEAAKEAGPPTPPKEPVTAVKSLPAPPAKSDSDPRLRDKIKEQRAALLEKESLLRKRDAALAEAITERDTARRDAEQAIAARKAAETETERVRRQRERDSRRAETTAVSLSAASQTKTKIVPPIASVPPSAPPFEDGLTRLLNRGRWAVVADVCHETLAVTRETTSSAPAARGRIYTLYAAALYGQGDASGGEEQDRLAATAFLDASEIVAAAESLARLLTQTPSGLRNTDAPLLKRLLGLSEKMGESEAVRGVFTRMRISSPDAYRRLRSALTGGGKKQSVFLQTLAPETTGSRLIGPDESITLSTVSVTPRRIAQGVESGEVGFLARVRDGVAAARTRGASGNALADALLEAVAALSPTAVFPLLQTATPRAAVVDASNVARHNPDPLAYATPPRVASLMEMREFLMRRGFFPIFLIADANLRFHVDDRAAYIDLIERNIVRETPPGTSADETLIAEARERAAPLITNDRLADWGESASRIERMGFHFLRNGISLTTF